MARGRPPIALLTALLAVAGCGGDSQPPEKAGGGQANERPASPRAGSGASRGAVAVSAQPSGAPAFEQESLEAKAGNVRLRFTNPSATAHSLCVEAADQGTLGCTGVFSADTATLRVHLPAGAYTFFCSVHRDAGMKGTLTVSAD
jgi:plastocyanin